MLLMSCLALIRAFKKFQRICLFSGIEIRKFLLMGLFCAWQNASKRQRHAVGKIPKNWRFGFCAFWALQAHRFWTSNWPQIEEIGGHFQGGYEELAIIKFKSFRIHRRIIFSALRPCVCYSICFKFAPVKFSWIVPKTN